MGGSLFTPAIAAFKKRYPKVELKLFERGSKAIEAALIDGELELGGVLEPVDLATFDVLPVSRQLLWLVAQKGSRWDTMTDVPLADLASESFVFYGESLALSDLVLSACREAGFHADHCQPQRALGLHGSAGAGRRWHCAAAGAVLPPAGCQRVHLPSSSRSGNSLGHGGPAGGATVICRTRRARGWKSPARHCRRIWAMTSCRARRHDSRRACGDASSR